MGLTRFEDWPERLDAYLADQERPYVLGVHDCCTFAAGAVEAITGKNVYEAFNATYRTEEEARCLLAFHGGLASLVGELLAEIPAGQASRGDVVLLTDETLGIVDLTGERLAVPGKRGLVFKPLTAATRAWRV